MWEAVMGEEEEEEEDTQGRDAERGKPRKVQE